MNLRIKKLDIFILKQFAVLFLGALFICQFVLMMQFLWRQLNDLIGKGLSLDVIAHFFWYIALMFVPMALPLAILLSSLITFGNLGESSELTAIKAAGISLMQSFRSLIVVTVLIAGVSFYFQNNIGPMANMKFAQLLLSMKQKSPELEIPEGIFYDGIPNCNIYVQKKNLKTGKLYGIMIYRMTQSYEDAAIILADSGMIQSTAEKKHLLLSLWSGEWFENMQDDQFGGTAAVPYRRESFISKQIYIDFDNGFNLTDMSALSNNARGKSLAQIRSDVDSLNETYDSIGRAFYGEAKQFYFTTPALSKPDSIKEVRQAEHSKLDFDQAYAKLTPDQKANVMSMALGNVQRMSSDLDFKAMMAHDNERIIRNHYLEAENKFALALQCIIFFFIGAPLGAIIRKGGLGLPVIISVLVYIIFYILDNTGYTTVVFNADGWIAFFRKAFGLRLKRSIQGKEVIIEEPHYAEDKETLLKINHKVTAYSRRHNLKSPPNVIKVFFKYQEDHEIEEINEELEATIKDLANTRDTVVLSLLNHYPVLAVKAHTRPFDRRWLNIVSAIIVPVGMFFYFRMWRFRLRLLRDLRVIKYTNTQLINHKEHEPHS